MKEVVVAKNETLTIEEQTVEAAIEKFEKEEKQKIDETFGEIKDITKWHARKYANRTTPINPAYGIRP